MKHIPVLLDRILEALGDIKGKTVVDCTFGAGGYTRAFLNAGADVIAFDRDPSVIQTADEISVEFGDRFKFINEPFSEIKNLPEKYDAVVFDFGVSSMQIDQADRGFSFRFAAPLDMRMGKTGQTAADLIKNSSVSELARILSNYGDIKKAGMFAKIIKTALPETTFGLKKIIHNPKDIAPIFQALRIAVNDELGQIDTALQFVPDVLKESGICACVTFHSLEDRIVKKFFRGLTTALGDPRLPELEPAKFKLLKTYRPSVEELENNQRSRSSHMRAIQKLY